MDFLLIRRLYHLEKNYSYPEIDIQNAIKKLGAIPYVLQEYYRQIGANEDVNQYQDHLCSPARLNLKNGFLPFYVAEQETLWWTIRQEDLVDDNPPVYVCMEKGTGYTYKLECDMLLNFLTAMAFSQALNVLPYNSEGVIDCDLDTKKRIESHYKKKAFYLLNTPYTTFYGNDVDEVIAIYENEDVRQVSFACTTERQYEEIEKLIFI